MKKFIPVYFVDTGREQGFFTLRVTKQVFIPGGGERGGSIDNGIYQGTIAIGSDYLQNLSTDKEEAFAKASEIAKRAGRELRQKSADEIMSEVYDFETRARRSAEEIEAARIREINLEAIREERIKVSKINNTMAWLAHDQAPFGKYKGDDIADLPAGYVRWIVTTDFEDENMNLFKGAVLRIHGEQAELRTPDVDGFVGDVGVRSEFTAQAISSRPFRGHFGPGCRTELVDIDTNKLIVCWANNFQPVVGEEVTFKASVKSHHAVIDRDGNDQAETTIIRVKLM